MPGWEEIVTEMETLFPGWHVWRSSAGRWWATRTGTVLGREDLGAGRVMTMDADEPQALRAQLERQSRLDRAVQR